MILHEGLTILATLQDCTEGLQSHDGLITPLPRFLRVKTHLYDQTEVVEFFPYVLSFLIPHHVGQITQTFGHTICQMSS